MDEPIRGLESLQAMSDKLDKAREAFGEEVLKRLQEYSPVLTGRLKNSWEKTDEDGVLTFTNTAVDEQGEPYAIFVEFGTVHMPGQFFATRVMAEADQIWQVAKQKSDL